jgi:hypothetical protein
MQKINTTNSSSLSQGVAQTKKEGHKAAARSPAIITKVIKLKKISTSTILDLTRTRKKLRISSKIISKIFGMVLQARMPKRIQTQTRTSIEQELILNIKNTKEGVVGTTRTTNLVVDEVSHTVEINTRNLKTNNRILNNKMKEMQRKMNFTESTIRISTNKVRKAQKVNSNSNRLRRKSMQITIRIAILTDSKKIALERNHLQRPIRNTIQKVIQCSTI